MIPWHLRNRLIASLLLLAALAGCGRADLPVEPLPDDLFSGTCEAGALAEEVQISASRATETVNILFVLGSYDNWTFVRPANPVHDDITKTFGLFKRHKARTLTTKLGNNSKNFIMPTQISALLQYDNGFKWTEDPSSIFAEVSDLGPTFADDYLDALNRFYIDARVEAFLAKHRDLYQAAIHEARANGPSKADIEIISAYYGASKKAYCLRPSLTLYSMAVSVDSILDLDDLGFMIAGTFSDMVPDAGQYGYQDIQKLRSLGFHEYGHSFLDIPEDLVTRSELLMAPVKDAMKRRAYGGWSIALEEHIDRAVEIRIWERIGEPEIAEQKRIDQADFAYLPIIEDLLITYENERDTSPSLAAYLPTLVEELVARADANAAAE